MKQHILAPFVMMLAISFFLAACGEQKPATEKPATTTQDIRKEARELADTALTYSVEQKEKYTQEILARLSQYNLKLMELDRKMSALGDQARNDMAAEITKINAQKSQVAAGMRELRASTGEAWKDVKVGLDKAIDDLDEAYRQVKSRY